jgi:hypothetical protein
MNLMGFVFDPDGSFYLFDGRPLIVRGNVGHSNWALRDALTNKGIPINMIEDFRYVCTAFFEGAQYRVHRMDKQWPINLSVKAITKHKRWPMNDPVFKGIIRTALIETA